MAPELLDARGFGLSKRPRAKVPFVRRIESREARQLLRHLTKTRSELGFCVEVMGLEPNDFYVANVVTPPSLTCSFAERGCSGCVQFGHRRALRCTEGQQMSHIESRRRSSVTTPAP